MHNNRIFNPVNCPSTTLLLVRCRFFFLRGCFSFVLDLFLILVSFPSYVFYANHLFDYLLSRVLVCARFVAHVVYVDDMPFHTIFKPH